MCRRFAQMERKLGEIDRARAIYAHASQFCDPRIMPEFWKEWNGFESESCRSRCQFMEHHADDSRHWVRRHLPRDVANQASRSGFIQHRGVFRRRASSSRCQGRREAHGCRCGRCEGSRGPDGGNGEEYGQGQWSTGLRGEYDQARELGSGISRGRCFEWRGGRGGGGQSRRDSSRRRRVLDSPVVQSNASCICGFVPMSRRARTS